MGAIGPGEGGEIRIDQLRAEDALGVGAFLMHADGAVHAVVDDDEDDGQAVLHGGRQLLPVHHEAAVAFQETTTRSGWTALAATAAGTP
jgi:hypothetical protein